MRYLRYSLRAASSSFLAAILAIRPISCGPVRAPLSSHDTAYPTPTEFYEIHLPIGSLGLLPGFQYEVCPEKNTLTQRTDPLPGPVSEAQRHSDHKEGSGRPSLGGRA